MRPGLNRSAESVRCFGAEGSDQPCVSVCSASQLVSESRTGSSIVRSSNGSGVLHRVHTVEPGGFNNPHWVHCIGRTALQSCSYHTPPTCWLQFGSWLTQKRFRN